MVIVEDNPGVSQSGIKKYNTGSKDVVQSLSPETKEAFLEGMKSKGCGQRNYILSEIEDYADQAWSDQKKYYWDGFLGNTGQMAFRYVAVITTDDNVVQQINSKVYLKDKDVKASFICNATACFDEDGIT